MIKPKRPVTKRTLLTVVFVALSAAATWFFGPAAGTVVGILGDQLEQSGVIEEVKP